MDPLTALGVAVNIFAVIDFSKTVYEILEEVKATGTVQSVANLRVLAKSLKESCEKVRKWECTDSASVSSHRDAFQTVQHLAAEVIEKATTLFYQLEDLHARKDASFGDRFRVAVKSIWKRGMIENSKAQLKSMQDELDRAVSILAREETKTAFAKTASLKALDESTRSIVEIILDSKQDLSAVMGNLVKNEVEKIYRLNRQEMANSESRHGELTSTLAEIKLMIREGSVSASEGPQNHQASIVGKIKDHLSFDDADERYDSIDHRYKNTFEWIYDSNDSEKRQTSFVDWLKADEGGLYWINGKAGSGKSTLIKFLSEDPRTIDALSLWANGKPLLVASYYAWGAGPSLARSQLGLLRSIILQALEWEPELGQILFPDMYKSEANWSEFPSTKHLSRAFRILTRQTQKPMKMALLVDGLDEFQTGDVGMNEIADFFEAFTKTPNSRAIVSSRPLKVFEAAFGTLPNLRLHELARQDFEIYVQGSLALNPQFLDLAVEDKEGTDGIITALTKNENAVFLGVKAAVRSLIEGFRNYDSIQELQERLKQLPSEVAYQDKVFADDTVFNLEEDGVWTFGDVTGSGTQDLVYIKTRNTGTGRVEVHAGSNESGFRDHFEHVGSAFDAEENGTWLMRDWTGSGRADLVYIKTRDTGSGKVEVHVATADSHYQHFALHKGSCFGQEENGTWTMSFNGDLVYIKTRKTGSDMIEYYVITRASDYQSVSEHIVTDFPAEDNGTWCFSTKGSGTFEDLHYIKTRNTGTGMTEVHTFSGKSKWRERLVDVSTSFASEDNGNWLMADYTGQLRPDLVYIKSSNTNTGKVQLHISEY